MFYSREFDSDANNNGWAGVIRAVTNTARTETVCIIYEPNVINGSDLANSLISGVYENRLSPRSLHKAWNSERTAIHFSIRDTLLFSVPITENVLQDEAQRLCLDMANVIYHLLTRGTMPDSYREDQPVEPISMARFVRSSSAQTDIENMVKVDDEILEDAFTCNMLIDRIKNCDTICSGDKKIKIIVREDSKEMMITNTVFDDNILVIDIDDVKEKELDDDESLYIRTGNGLWTQTNQAVNANSFMYNIDLNNYLYNAPNIATSGSSNVF